MILIFKDFKIKFRSIYLLRTRQKLIKELSRTYELLRMEILHTSVTHCHDQRNLLSALILCSFSLRKSSLHDFQVLELCTVFNSYFTWLFRISVCDNTGYISCLFCFKLEYLVSSKRRNLFQT